LPNLLIHSYYYRGKSHRQAVKTLLQIDNNITGAKNRLDTAVQEHDNYISSRGIINDGNNFTSADNYSLHHCKEHLDRFINSAQQQAHQKNAAITALDESEPTPPTPPTPVEE
jgi:hypothetical protein